MLLRALVAADRDALGLRPDRPGNPAQARLVLRAGRIPHEGRRRRHAWPQPGGREVPSVHRKVLQGAHPVAHL
eukprot:12097442-Alexandrium_andersonii.AAC.1